MEALVGIMHNILVDVGANTETDYIMLSTGYPKDKQENKRYYLKTFHSIHGNLFLFVY
jgi:hypothetical protein